MFAQEQWLPIGGGLDRKTDPVETYLLLVLTENLDFGQALSLTAARAAEHALRFLDRQLKVSHSPAGDGAA
jgi:hypothetical protein